MWWQRKGSSYPVSIELLVVHDGVAGDNARSGESRGEELGNHGVRKKTVSWSKPES